MVQLKGRDDLSGFKGIVSDAFEAQNLAALQERFIASQPREAVDVLTQFYSAAEDLRTSENAFNARAKKSSGPDLKTNLRSAGQFAAIRGFKDAKENLLGVNSAVGEQIVELVEKSITAQATKRAFTT